MAREDYDVTTLRGAVRILRKHCLDMGTNCVMCGFWNTEWGACKLCGMSGIPPYQWEESWCREEPKGQQDRYREAVEGLRRQEKLIKSAKNDKDATGSYIYACGYLDALRIALPEKEGLFFDEFRQCAKAYYERSNQGARRRP